MGTITATYQVITPYPGEHAADDLTAFYSALVHPRAILRSAKSRRVSRAVSTVLDVTVCNPYEVADQAAIFAGATGVPGHDVVILKKTRRNH